MPGMLSAGAGATWTMAVGVAESPEGWAQRKERQGNIFPGSFLQASWNNTPIFTGEIL